MSHNGHSQKTSYSQSLLAMTTRKHYQRTDYTLSIHICQKKSKECRVSFTFYSQTISTGMLIYTYHLYIYIIHIMKNTKTFTSTISPDLLKTVEVKLRQSLR